MEVPSRIRKNVNPITSECQIIPNATTLKRGRLVLGVLLCIRGNKIHYYSFVTQGKQSVFEEWLFRMPVYLGLNKIKDFQQLKSVLQTSINIKKDINVDDTTKERKASVRQEIKENAFDEIRKTFSHIEAVTISNAVNASANKILDSINGLTENIKSGFNVLDIKAQTNKDLIESIVDHNLTLARKIQDLEREISSLEVTNEYHVSNSLNFNDCNFNTNDDLYERYHHTSHHDDEQSTAGGNGAQSFQEHTYEDTPDNSPFGDGGVRVFESGEVIKEHHWDAFYHHYSKIDILDVIYAEIQWLKNNNYKLVVEQLAPLVMGISPPILHQPKMTSLFTVFKILRTSRISR